MNEIFTCKVPTGIGILVPFLSKLGTNSERSIEKCRSVGLDTGQVHILPNLTTNNDRSVSEKSQSVSLENTIFAVFSGSETF